MEELKSEATEERLPKNSDAKGSEAVPDYVHLRRL